LLTAQADEGLDVAADRMNWHQVGALPVLDGQRLAGIMVVGGRDPVASPPSV
jgi:CBS domain-containing protein